MGNKTKILAIVILLFICKCELLHGQSYYVSVGTNLSKLNQQKNEPSEEITRTLKPGLEIGPSVEFKLNRLLSINPGIYLSLKREYSEYSTIIEGTDPFRDILFESNSSQNKFYIDLPISFKLEYSFNTFSIFCLSGPYINMLIADSDKTEVYFDGSLVPNPTEVGEEKFSNRFDYGVNLGVGVQFKSYILQLKYDYGLYHMLKYENFDDDITYRNLVFRITLGYKIL